MILVNCPEVGSIRFIVNALLPPRALLRSAMSTPDSLHYLTDAHGKLEAVVLPIADWLELKESYRQLQSRELVLNGMREVPEILAGRKSEITLTDFLANS